MTNQAALDAQDAILAADVNTLTTVTQNVVTGVATLNNTNQALTAEVASLQSQLAAGQPLNLTNLVNLTNGVSAANALLLAAVAPVTAPAPPAAAPAAPNPAGTAPAPAAPPTGGTS
jgi:ribosomal protein L12E/L44/L45/RPP1/RPP2